MRIGTKKQPESVILQAVRNALVIDGYDVTRHQQGLGCRKGFPDLTALKDGKTLYVEIKTATGKQSPWQVEFQKSASSTAGPTFWLGQLTILNRGSQESDRCFRRGERWIF